MSERQKVLGALRDSPHRLTKSTINRSRLHSSSSRVISSYVHGDSVGLTVKTSMQPNQTPIQMNNNHHRKPYDIHPGSTLAGPMLLQITEAFPLTPDVNKTRSQWIAEHEFYFSGGDFLGIYRDSKTPGALWSALTSIRMTQDSPCQ